MLVQLLFPVNPYQRSDVGIGLLVQQKLSDSVVATVSSDMQRCEVVQRDIINRRFVLQQEFNTLYVVSLGRHVQWGQSVLCEKKNNTWIDAKGQKKQLTEERDGRDGRRKEEQTQLCALHTNTIESLTFSDCRTTVSWSYIKLKTFILW